MPSEVLKPITGGVKFKKGSRYMMNKDTRVVFSYADYMDDLDWMIEIFPEFPEDKDIANEVAEVEVKDAVETVIAPIKIVMG